MEVIGENVYDLGTNHLNSIQSISEEAKGFYMANILRMKFKGRELVMKDQLKSFIDEKNLEE